MKRLRKKNYSKLQWLNKGLFLIFALVILVVCSLVIYKSYDTIENISINKLEIEGTNPYIKDYLNKRLSFLLGEKIFDLDLNLLNKYLSSLSWIDKVSIYRNLNGLIKITIIEKNPYFLWRDDRGFYRVVDSAGDIVKVKLGFETNKLIFIEGGSEALYNSSLIRFIIYQDYTILHMIKKISFNGYRWNIVLKNGIVLKMPENDIQIAYKKIINANKKYNMLNKNVIYVDATTVNKLYIKPSKQNIY